MKIDLELFSSETLESFRTTLNDMATKAQAGGRFVECIELQHAVEQIEGEQAERV